MNDRTTNQQYDHHRGSDPLLRPTARGRTVAMLGMNLVLFVASCSFLWQYLATGHWLDPSAEAYVAGMNTPLSGILVHPLSIFAHPWMILVNSLLLALMFFVPLVIAVMYHEIVALGFVLVVAAVGRAPALALLQAVGCVLAARTRLRSDSPFLAVLLGMSPLLAYMLIFALTVGESARVPLQKWMLYSVVGSAMLLGVLAAAGELGLVKVLRYKPGALCPVMIVTLTAAAVVFRVRVGPDELAYALLTAELDRPGEPDRLFESVSLEKWQEAHGAERLGRDELKGRLRRELDRRKADLIDRCDRFLAAHGDSDRAPGVLWIKAQLQSLALDEADYEDAYDAVNFTNAPGIPKRRAVLISHCAEFVEPASEKTWRRLLKNHPGSSHATLAAWRLGVLALRRQDVAAAEKLLSAAKTRLLALRKKTAALPQRGRSERVFVPVASVPHGNADYYEEALGDIERLLWLMRENHVKDDPPSAEALGEYLKISRRDPHRLEHLAVLAGRYEGTHMGDNLKLAEALMTTDTLTKARKLIKLAEDKVSDAGIEANYKLAYLRMGTGSASALPLMVKLKKPREYFNIVASARDNPWGRIARERLAQLHAQSKPSP